MKNLTEEQIEQVAQSVAGGCQDHYGEELLEKFGADPSELEEVCAEVEVYKCPTCCWWGHSGELLEHENPQGEYVCEDCAEE